MPGPEGCSVHGCVGKRKLLFRELKSGFLVLWQFSLAHMSIAGALGVCRKREIRV